MEKTEQQAPWDADTQIDLAAFVDDDIIELANLDTALGGHADQHIILPAPPTDDEKWSYAKRSLPMLVTAITASAICITAAQLLLEVHFLIALPFLAYTLSYLVYQLLSIPVNFGGKSFDVVHHRWKAAMYRPKVYPDVDVFLPICGEPPYVLRNTWEGVAELASSYPGRVKPYVLDDGWSVEARSLAAEFGFSYVRRNDRTFKKAGNLRHAFSLTTSPFIVIFDADFRPRPDFLRETLPYMEDKTIGIVQTPQFFRALPEHTWVERAAAVSLEVFYRSVQQARDRFGSALCVGSNAVYRREALEPVGGCALMPYAEDSHTGLEARKHGYSLKYLPIPLAAGVCPPTVDSLMRQQYRWSNGASSLVWHGHMWRVPMKWTARLPYVAGWLWNFTTAFRTVITPLIPVMMLIFLPHQVRLSNAVLLIIPMLVGAVIYPAWHRARWTLACWPVAVAVGWAQALALWDFSRGKVMSWQPTIGPAATSRRFRKCVIGWNGTLGTAWLGLAVWRLVQSGSYQFSVVIILGIVNALIIGRIIFPGSAK